MHKRSPVVTVLSIFLFCLVPLLAACGGTSDSSTSANVTLKYLNWNKSDVGTQFAAIVKQFHTAHPNITIQVENIDTNQYEQVLQTRLVSGDAPDIIASHGGPTFAQEVQANDFLDLSDQSWVANEQASAKAYASVSGKDYGLVLSQSIAGVIYNKQIFSRLNLQVPQSWADFLNVCAKLKAAGVTPVALGYKDEWTTQLIPYTMGPTAIFRNDPAFNKELASGQTSFAKSSAWQEMLQDTQSLITKGYTNQGPSGTTYNQAIQLLDTSNAAMYVMGNWAIPSIQQGNSALQLGMFPMPYKNPPYYVATSPTQLLGISAKTQHKTEAEQFLDFWANDKVASTYLSNTQQLPAITNATLPANPIYSGILPDLKNGTHLFLNSEWPKGVDQALEDGVQGLAAGTANVSQVLQNMDNAYQTNKSTLPTQ